MMDENPTKVCHSPLCAFCLSPAFSIRILTHPPEKSASRRLSVRTWRRGDSSLPSVRPRFKPLKRGSSHFLNKYLTGLHCSKGETLGLQDVLDEIQKAWRPHKSCKPPTMDERARKTSAITTSERVSPILLRRRLSAPETIMRKHRLAQQRSESQESYLPAQTELQAGSDSNLNQKRDPDFRKTTLLRRLWNHSKTRFSGSFYEWQHSGSGRLSTNSLNSTQSSPERLIRSQSKRSLSGEFKTSPIKKMSPKHQNHEANRLLAKLSPKRKASMFNGNYDYSSSFSETTTTRRTSTTITPSTETTTRDSNTSYTTFSEISDSAFTNNSRSNYSSNNNSTTTHSEIKKEIIEDTDASNQDMQANFKPSDASKSSANNESSTQTADTTNVNVISNVHLSQSTLDLIFSQVMQDVKNEPSNINFSSSVNNQIINVQQLPGFHLKPKEAPKKLLREKSTIMSNIGIGSPYHKTPEAGQNMVARYSALPETSSMEVNTSSGDSDKDSDTVSFVDSLEDSTFPTDTYPKDPVTKSDSLELPDNSDRVTKSTAFFIPIELDHSPKFQAVSELLPDKVKSKLLKRQQKREENQAKSKLNTYRSDSNYLSASENGNHQFVIHSGPDVNLNCAPAFEVYRKPKLRNHKPLLPTIETLRRIKIDRNSKSEEKTQKYGKPSKRKPTLGDARNRNWTPKVGTRAEKLSPLCTKNEYVYDCGPRRFYHKTEFNNTDKRIEILEIMECVDPTARSPPHGRKSKIPISVNQKLPKIPQQRPNFEKPVYLDLDESLNDSKLDQLIANILIETLNTPDIELPNEPPEPAPTKPISKYQHKFEVIPEELSLQSSTDDVSNNNEADADLKATQDSNYQGKAAVAVVKDDNFASIPKGWITFYMLHKNNGSPDSTSDEGKKSDNNNKSRETIENDKILIRKESTPPSITDSCDVLEKEKSNEVARENCSSSSDIRATTALPPANNGRYKKYNQRKGRHRSNSDHERFKPIGEWSVTLTGTSSYGNVAPDLEMRLKFPDSRKPYVCPSQSDSGLGEDTEKSHFPKITTRIDKYRNKPQIEDEDLSVLQRLPEIDRSKLPKKQRSDSSVPSLGSYNSVRIEPRPTRTSTRRYNMTRPKFDQIQERRNTAIFNERHYAEILRRFPEILSITGNAIKDKK